jgi:hypothetical protein
MKTQLFWGGWKPLPTAQFCCARSAFFPPSCEGGQGGGGDAQPGPRIHVALVRLGAKTIGENAQKTPENYCSVPPINEARFPGLASPPPLHKGGGKKALRSPGRRNKNDRNPAVPQTRFFKTPGLVPVSAKISGWRADQHEGPGYTIAGASCWYGFQFRCLVVLAIRLRMTSGFAGLTR